MEIDLSKLTPVAEGWYGYIYKVEIESKTYALKKFKPTMHEDLGVKFAAYDYEILADIGHSEHFPTLHSYKEKEWFVMDYIDGIPFRQVENKEKYRWQLEQAYMDSVVSGWFPDDVKGNNIYVSQNKIIILDVGSFLPYRSDIKFDIESRVDFVIRNADKYPSVREDSPYELEGRKYA